MQRIEILEHIFGILSFNRNVFKHPDNISNELNKTQKKVLMHLAIHGPTPMNKVSEKMGLEKGSFTQVADSLENIRFIKRVRSKEDRRIILLELTREGMDFAEKAHSRTIERVESLLGKLTPQQQSELMDSLKCANKYINIMLEKDQVL